VGEVQYTEIITPKGTIILRTFTNTMSKSEIIDSFKYLLDSEMLTSNNLGMITDIRESVLEIDISDLEKMADFISNNKLLSNIKLAVIANSSNEALYPTLINFKIGDKLLPFNSIEEAKEWMIKD